MRRLPACPIVRKRVSACNFGRQLRRATNIAAGQSIILHCRHCLPAPKEPAGSRPPSAANDDRRAFASRAASASPSADSKLDWMANSCGVETQTRPNRAGPLWSCLGRRVSALIRSSPTGRFLPCETNWNKWRSRDLSLEFKSSPRRASVISDEHRA